MKQRPPGQVVTFYSYKGGVGRSFALANVGVLLARWGYRVLCIDWDLEAPGLGHYFQRWTGRSTRKGLVPMVEAFAKGRRPKWRNHATRLQVPGVRNRLDFISAGDRGKDYVQRVQSINWEALYRKKKFGPYVETLREEWKRHYDFVLIDSRTGISDIAGICTVQMPDTLVFLFTANHQSIDGACDIAERSISSRNHLPFDRARLVTLPIVSRYEQRIEFKRASRWDQMFKARLKPFYRSWLPARTDLSKIIAATRLPNVPYWSFGEELPVVVDQRRNDDSEAVNYPLLNIAALLANQFADAHHLITGRESYLARSRRTRAIPPKTEKQGRAVFISHAPGSRSYAQTLASHLHQRSFTTNLSSAFAKASHREELLDVLKQTSSLVLIVEKEVIPSQYDEMETYVSLNIRNQKLNQVIFVLRSPEARKNLPKFWSKPDIVVASKASIGTVASQVIKLLDALPDLG